jgi:hypothetical protein
MVIHILLKRNLGCPPSSLIIIGREKQNLHLVEVGGILTRIYVRKREDPWRCYRLLWFFVIFFRHLHVFNVACYVLIFQCS